MTLVCGVYENNSKQYFSINLLFQVKLAFMVNLFFEIFGSKS